MPEFFMKIFSLALISLVFVSTAYGLENGNYINKQYNETDAALYKSLKISTEECNGSEGAIVKFYGADAMNFCVGHSDRKVYKHKKCLGRKLPYPISRCVGVEKSFEEINTKEVSQDEKTGAVILTEKNVFDGSLVFEQTYEILEDSNGNLEINYSFISHRDGRSGSKNLFFEK